MSPKWLILPCRSIGQINTLTPLAARYSRHVHTFCSLPLPPHLILLYEFVSSMCHSSGYVVPPPLPLCPRSISQSSLPWPDDGARNQSPPKYWVPGRHQDYEEWVRDLPIQFKGAPGLQQARFVVAWSRIGEVVPPSLMFRGWRNQSFFIFQRVFHVASVYCLVVYTRVTCRNNSKHLNIHNKCYVHVAKLFQVVANVGLCVAYVVNDCSQRFLVVNGKKS